VRIVFWLALAGILYTYAGYPLLIWLLARLGPRRWKRAPITPTVDIVLAVHNGMEILPNKLDQLLSLDYERVANVIVVSDGSTDGTAGYLEQQQRSRLHKIVLMEQAGKAVALNAGLAHATSDIVLFVDIRPEIAPGAVQQLVSNFGDPSVGCVAGRLLVQVDMHSATAASVGGLYWRYEQWIRECEALVDSPVGVYGGFYAVRRELAVCQPAGTILDDMFQPLSIIRLGYRSVVDPDAVVYDTWPKKAGDEFQRKVRTLAGNFQLFQLAPWTLTPSNRVFVQLISHKLLRLVVPYLFILLLCSSMVLARRSPADAAFAAVQLLGWATAILGLRFKLLGLDRIAGPAGALLMLNVAAVVAVYKFFFAPRPLWKIWNVSSKILLADEP